jgi:hypothetical protein
MIPPKIEPIEGYPAEDTLAVLVTPKKHLAAKLGLSVAKLNQLVDEGRFGDVQAVANEIRAMVELRALSLAPAALDALEGIVTGQTSIEPTAMSATVRAADSILDRTVLPKRARQQDITPTLDEANVPSLTDMLKGSTPEQATEIIRSYKDALNQLDALRLGAKEIIDVTPSVR